MNSVACESSFFPDLVLHAIQLDSSESAIATALVATTVSASPHTPSTSLPNTMCSSQPTRVLGAFISVSAGFGQAVETPKSVEGRLRPAAAMREMGSTRWDYNILQDCRGVHTYYI